MGPFTSFFFEVIGLSTRRGRFAATGILLLGLFLTGPDRLEQRPSICLLSKIIGRPCPACGITRAAAALSRGQIIRAARYNFLIFPATTSLALVLYQDLITSPSGPGYCKVGEKNSRRV